MKLNISANIMNADAGGAGLDDPFNVHVCINKIMRPLMIVIPILVMFSIVFIKVCILMNKVKSAMLSFNV